MPDIKVPVYVSKDMSIGFFKKIVLALIQEKSRDGRGKPFFLHFNLDNRDTIKTIIQKKIDYTRRVHANFDDGKTIDVFLEIDKFDLPIYSQTNQKFIMMKNLKDTDTLNEFFVRLSKTPQTRGYVVTHLTLKNNGKEILNIN